MVPHDDFTPHGYLDNPYHSWKLNPSGVLRSREPLGNGLARAQSWHLCTQPVSIYRSSHAWPENWRNWC